jgi:septal ring factor EnvC (AmiA/AmiB activator)
VSQAPVTLRLKSNRQGKRFPKALGHALMLLCVFAFTSSIATPSFAKGDREQSLVELKMLQDKIRKAQEGLLLKQGAKKSEVRALRVVEKDISGIQRQIGRSSAAIAQQFKKLAGLQERQDNLRRMQAKEKDMVAAHLQRAYRLGRQSKVKLLLNQEDPATISRTLGLYNYINNSHQEQIETYFANIAELETLKPAISAEADKLKKEQQLLKNQKEAFDKQKALREKTLAVIDRDIRSAGKQIQNLEAERKAIETLLQTLEENLAELALPDDFLPFPDMRGKLRWPAKGKHQASFGQRRGETGLRWQGVQIAGNTGASVTAVHHGRVVFADWLRGAGMLMILDHGDGYFTLYSQNQVLNRELGDWVQPGDVIAEVGTQNGGLYFEMRKQGKPINPKPWFKRG